MGMAKLIEGKAIAQAIRGQVRAEAAKLPRPAGLAVVQLGDGPASQSYLLEKERDCKECGFSCFVYCLPRETSQEELLELIGELNEDQEIDGILMQMPLPLQIDPQAVVMSIDPRKDVEGFHPLNVGRMSLGHPLFIPCTPAAVMELLHAYEIPVKRKRCVVVGRSNTVGKPLSRLLMEENGTVTICHSYTSNLEDMTRQADILVSAVGKLNLITAGMVKEGAVVVDVAVNQTPEGEWLGDVDFYPVAEKASWITPIPGGIAPVTRALLMRNLLQAALLFLKEK